MQPLNFGITDEQLAMMEPLQILMILRELEELSIRLNTHLVVIHNQRRSFLSK